MRGFYFSAILFMIVVSITLSGCSSEGNDVVDQNEVIIKYLKSKDIKYELQNGVYKQIVNSDRIDYDNATVVERGDSLKFDFALCQFTGSAVGGVYYTSFKGILNENGLNQEFWDLNPRSVKLGSTLLVSGLDLGLPNSRVGDSLLLYTPSGLGFGDATVGLVAPNSSLVWIVKIIDVKKANK